VLAQKLARAVYDRLTREQAFDLTRFVTASPLRGGREPTVSLADAGQSLGDTHTLCSSDCEGVSGYKAPSPTR